MNISHDCQLTALSRRQQLDDLSLEQKRAIFHPCCVNIEQLMTSSVLPPFYGSPEFAMIQVQQRQVARTSSHSSVPMNGLNPMTRSVSAGSNRDRSSRSNHSKQSKHSKRKMPRNPFSKRVWAYGLNRNARMIPFLVFFLVARGLGTIETAPQLTEGARQNIAQIIT